LVGIQIDIWLTSCGILTSQFVTRLSTICQPFVNHMPCILLSVNHLDLSGS